MSLRVFYNEWDRQAAAWLNELARKGHVPGGVVDTRSIADLKGVDVDGYDQCHFFAGIGGWPLALRWAGLEGISGIWTGSPPCQPFSSAGQKKGIHDERHLAPVWLDLIRQHRPAAVFGEQVAAAIQPGWLDALFDALETWGYTCGSAVLPACSVGAPHLRRRLFFGAVLLADDHGYRRQTWERLRGTTAQPRTEPGCPTDLMGDAGCQPQPAAGNAPRAVNTGRAGTPGELADADCQGFQGRRFLSECEGEWPSGAGSLDGRPCAAYYRFWDGADWLGCRDGRLRPVEPGTFPLADGIPERVGRLRGYGNAIVPQVAAGFVQAFMDSAAQIQAMRRAG